MENYKEVNRVLWNERTKHHVDSDFYNVDGFLNGEECLKEIELGLLGDVNGKSILHLQCHFGQDSLSLARKGAFVTGVDLSDKAIEKAKELNTQMGLNAEFIVSDVYDLSSIHDKQYDIVFTTYGTIGWLPDMKKWAGVISKYLKPGGKLIFVDFHPVVWMFDNNLSYVQYSYFNREPIVENESGTYADTGAPVQLESVGWNHDLGEVIQNLINSGLKIEQFAEYDFSPYNVLANPVEVEKGRYMVKDMEGKLPLVYSIVAVKE